MGADEPPLAEVAVEDGGPSGQAGLRGSASCDVELEGRPRGASSVGGAARRVRSSVERSMECGRLGGAGSGGGEAVDWVVRWVVVMLRELVLLRESDGTVVSG